MYADAGMLSAYPMSAQCQRESMIVVPNELTVIELQTMMNNRCLRHDQSFAVVLERCYTRIRRCASVRVQECSFAIPPFVPGLPLYDNEVCRDYTTGHLLKNGFTVSHNGLAVGAVLQISWRPSNTHAYGQPNTMAAFGRRAQQQQQQQQQPQHPQQQQRQRMQRNISDFRPAVRFP